MQQKLLETSELAREKEVKLKMKTKTWYDQKARERSFDVGQEVLVLLPEDATGVMAQWHGPYQIDKKVSPVSYIVRMPERKKKLRQFHVNAVTPTIHTVVIADDEGDELLTAPTHPGEKNTKETPHDQENLSKTQAAELEDLLEELADTFSDQPS